MLKEHFHNLNKRHGEYPKKLRSILSISAAKAALNEISSWDGYKPTPLLSLEKISSQIGVNSIYFKDESSRFELNSFKALGGTYGVLKFLQDILQVEIGEKKLSNFSFDTIFIYMLSDMLDFHLPIRV